MKQNTVIIAIVAALILLLAVGGGAFLLGRGGTPSNGTGNEATAANGGTGADDTASDEPAAEDPLHGIPAEALKGTWTNGGVGTAGDYTVTFTGEPGNGKVAAGTPKGLVTLPYSMGEGAVIEMQGDAKLGLPMLPMNVRYFDGKVLVVEKMKLNGSGVNNVLVLARDGSDAKAIREAGTKAGVTESDNKASQTYVSRLLQEGVLNEADNLVKVTQ
jgi:hypothetical protein